MTKILSKKMTIIIIMVAAIGVAAFAIVSYNRKNTIENKIGHWVNNNCQSNKACTVNIADLTEFDWDKMLVFEYGFTKKQVEEIIDTSLENHLEQSRKIVFLKDGEVVHHEQLPTNVEHNVDGQVIFDGLVDNYAEYANGVSFNAQKQEGVAGTYYTLRKSN